MIETSSFDPCALTHLPNIFVVNFHFLSVFIYFLFLILFIHSRDFSVSLYLLTLVLFRLFDFADGVCRWW